MPKIKIKIFIVFLGFFSAHASPKTTEIDKIKDYVGTNFAVVSESDFKLAPVHNDYYMKKETAPLERLSFIVLRGSTLKNTLMGWAEQNPNDKWQIIWPEDLADIRMDATVTYNKSFTDSVSSLFSILPKDAGVRAEGSYQNKAIHVIKEGR